LQGQDTVTRTASRTVIGAVAAAMLVGAALSGQGRSRSVTPVTAKVMAAPSPNDWLSWRGTTRSQGDSALNQINRTNVSQLKAVWTRPMKPGWQETAPLVHDGVMYLANNGGTVEALDAATGDLLWSYTPPAREGEGASPSAGTVRGMS